MLLLTLGISIQMDLGEGPIKGTISRGSIVLALSETNFTLGSFTISIETKLASDTFQLLGYSDTFRF